MSAKSKTALSGGIVVIALVILQSIEKWTVVDAVLTGLRNSGPAGAFLVSLLLSPTLALVVALAAIFLSLENRRDRESRKSPPDPIAPLPSIDSSSRVGNSGNVTQQVFVGREEKPIPEIPIPKKEAPRLEFVQAEALLLQEDARCTWNDITSGQAHRNALVAEFRNTPKSEVGAQTPNAESVLATLVFQQEGYPKLHISHGTWLNEYTYLVTFRSGQTHKLIIAVKGLQKIGDILPFATLENHKSFNPFVGGHWRSGTAVYGSEPKVIPSQDGGQVSAALVDRHGVTVFQGVFRYVLSDKEMTLTPLLR
jgi:hypothetical protein